LAYEQRPGDISVFQERDKKNERAPDWRGTALIQIPDNARPGDVVKMEVALWAKGNSGTMLAGSIKVNDRQQGGGDAQGFRRQGESRMAGGSSGRQDPFDDTPW
jgi:hypothetical protein